MQEEPSRSWWSLWSVRILMSIGGLALVAVAATAFVISLGGGGSSEVSLAEGQRAPDFSITSADGQTVSLSDFEGKPVLLYFSMGYG